MKRRTYDSKIGKITIFEKDNCITKIVLNDSKSYNEYNSPIIQETIEQIEQYFTGKRKVIDVPVTYSGSAFKKAVLSQIRSIEYGQTSSYKELAMAAGYPDANRAVGTACKTNPLPLIIPCHRVIRSDWSLGEFVGGKEMKKTLIELEKSYNID